MGGFFLDDLIRSVARTVRREVRRNGAEKWTLIEGKVRRFQAKDEPWNDFRPVVDYSYEVGGESWYGTVTGFSMSRTRVDGVGDAVDQLPSIWVRYDPVDASQSRVLNEDNPKLPFEVDLNEGV
jgi:hypothetical protein